MLWLEGPNWTEHVIYETPDAPFDNVCFAPHDVDNDGLVDFALGTDWQPGNSDSGGTIDYLATIEPWHGDKVVVYLPGEDWRQSDELWSRSILDDQLAWGHAVACANLDNDVDQELIVGIRDNLNDHSRCGLRIYDPTTDAAPGQWSRTLVDPGGVAIEDLAVADLDADGDIDIVAVGRATHNVRIYWNQLVK